MNEQFEIANNSVRWWLFCLALAVLMMVAIGGITRLTDSGLSITEWKPVTGILPPLTEASWIEEFQQYQLSPEYQLINFTMNLSEFKNIYWIEYLHRLAGRATGLLLLVPFLYFLKRSFLIRTEIITFCLVGTLFLAQGVMGWYMVKSGLIKNPHVSHYRLAAHLMLAILIYSIIFWRWLWRTVPIKNHLRINNKPIGMYYGLLLIIVLQIILGALVAGLKAGLIYNQFPNMGTTFIPAEITDADIAWYDLNQAIAVQFLHRLTAYILIGWSVVSTVKLYKVTPDCRVRMAAKLLLLILGLQVILGILTLIYQVPLALALAHQLNSLFLLSSNLYIIFLLQKS